MTQANVSSCREIESSLFLEQLAFHAAQPAAAPVPWSQLTDLRAQAVPLHVECIKQRTFAAPQSDALDELKRFASAPTQLLFAEKNRYQLLPCGRTSSWSSRSTLSAA